jgi:hypothetical protein
MKDNDNQKWNMVDRVTGLNRVLKHLRDSDSQFSVY